ncbi:hypothetical protein [Salinarimonas sp.]|uniref:hypothetical protein n=1 Tax=Salinarimonas sp. TaxID=2766526 RepID=UPI0032D9048B
MKLDPDVLRSLALRAEVDCPLDVAPTAPVIDIDESEGFRVSIAVPTDAGPEFTHWRILCELDWVRAEHQGRPGLGRSGGRIMRLTAAGHEFVELARDEDRWRDVLARLRLSSAATPSLILSELKNEARKQLRRLRTEDSNA